MDISQLVIAVGAVIGIVVIGLLAVVPSLLEFPGGADHDEPAAPGPAPLASRRKRAHSHRNDIDLAA